MITATLILKKGRDKPILNQHPWLFSGAIARVVGQPTPGDLVQVQSNDGRFLATAYYNPYSQIRGRIVSWVEGETIDDLFWQQRLRQAIDGRRALALEPATTAYRLVNAEADGLPGLIVDKYDDFLVIQCLTLGIDCRKEMLITQLVDLLQPAGIIERSDVSIRKKEGLPPLVAHAWGQEPPETLIVLENGHQFHVRLHDGHKTGLYLDQRANRMVVCQPHFVKGKTVLNTFAYTGGFAIYAAANGAQAITNVDSSVTILEQAETNIILNGSTQNQHEYIAGDAFEVLRYYRDNGRLFDLIILDPPKFAHSQRDINRASRGYKDLNWLALRLLQPGGILATFSCSGLISAELFQKIVFGATVDAQRHTQIIQKLGQAPDHPIALTFPESAYLKGLLCRVW